MTLMGTGTSHGIPVVGCSCHVCSSKDSRDQRLRCSALIQCYDSNEPNGRETSVVIDTGPEFRIQCLKFKVRHVDGVLLTHSHADHCHGLDDLRIFSFRKIEGAGSGNLQELMKSNPGMSENDARIMMESGRLVETEGEGLPIYASSSTIESIIFRFAYIFNKMAVGGGTPKLNLKIADEYSHSNPVKIGSIEAVPVPMIHGTMVDYGWVIRQKSEGGQYHSIVYLTDCNQISDESIEIVKNAGGVIEHLVIDGLRKTPHPTHCNFDQALSYADRIGGRHTWLTHICHDFLHTEIQEYINEKLPDYPELYRIVENGGSVSPAYDGLELTVEHPH